MKGRIRRRVGPERRLLGSRRIDVDDGLGPNGVLLRLPVTAGDRRGFALRLGRFGLPHGALRVDAPTGVDGVVADRAAQPGRDRRVEMLWVHGGRPVGGG
jgi:hypothetical protein